MLRKLALFVLCAAVFSGCGNKQEIVTVAETEGDYVDVAGLTYQVQLSRFLKPGDVEDKQYLMGLPEGVPAELPGDNLARDPLKLEQVHAIAVLVHTERCRVRVRADYRGWECNQ